MNKQSQRKGKLKGYILIVILIIAAIGAYRWYDLNHMKTTQQEITILVNAYNVDEHISQNIASGDRVIGQTKKQKDLVESVDVTEAYKSVVNKAGKLEKVMDATKQNIQVRIKCHARISDVDIFSGEQMIKVGMTYMVRTAHVQFPAYITSIELSE